MVNTSPYLIAFPNLHRRFSIFTLGQTDYTFLRRSPSAFFRLLLHTFTPDDLKPDLLRLYPIPGPRAMCLSASGRWGVLWD